MGTPLVSFIIATWNTPPKLLQRCVGSILALPLSRAEREIIVVDDGSDESPAKLISQYGRDIMLERQVNKGLSEARNHGLELATGRYVQFVDADDMLIREPYAFCLETARKTDADIVAFDFQTTSSDGAPTEVFPDNENPFTCYESGADYMLESNIRAAAPLYLFKPDKLGELRFTPSIVHEDEEFTPLLLLGAGKVCVTNTKAYLYYKHSGTITSSGNLRMKARRLADVRGVLSRLKQRSALLTGKSRLALERRIAQLTMDYIYKVIIETRSHKHLGKSLLSLKSEDLFPLPARSYTTKYRLFRLATSTSMGRLVLLLTLPLISKER